MKNAKELGQELAALVAAHGSLDAAEAAHREAAPGQIVRTYVSAQEFEADSQAMVAGGWRIVAQSVQQGHVNVRRTGARIITGGVLLGGASRSKDQIMVTYARD